MSLPVALTQGTVIGGHYIIGRLINSGGFGAVYRGIDTSEGNRPCAIKETYDVTPSARRQALMEASVLFTVRSEHLPEVYDALESNGRFYLVMQLIEGQNLLEVLQSRIGGTVPGEQMPNQHATGPCSEQEVLAWFLPIMDVLQELHNRNPAVIHRDIKPGNIILTPQQTTVLVDFGLTKLYDPRENTQTIIKAVTEGFSPIEQYMGRTSPLSDIYSLAATMYLLLTNRLPPASINRSIHDELIAPRQLNPSLSVKTERTLLKALSVNPDQRYQNMREFAQILREPAFSAFADTTIALPPLEEVVSQAINPTHSAHAYTGVQSLQPSYMPQTQTVYPQSGYSQPVHPLQPQSGYSQPVHPSPSQTSYPQPAYPQVANRTPAQPPIPSGYVTASPSPLAPAQRLPDPFGQGCLWGLLQGILAGLMVAFMRGEEYFYLATLMGFFFYVITGFMTTRKGGVSLRGAWSGYWSGIISTCMFWFVLGIGLLIRFLQQIQFDTTAARLQRTVISPNELNHAWRAVQPAFPTHPLVQGQPLWVNLIIYLVGGLAVTTLLGWVGGILGKSQHKKSG